MLGMGNRGKSVELTGAAADSELRRRLYITNVYALLALLSLGIFGALQVWVEHNPLIGYLEVAGACAVAWIIIAMAITRNANLGRSCLLLTMLVFIVVMFTSGGTQGTGIFWSFMFPVTAFFLAGKRQGMYWMALLVTSITALWVAAQIVYIPYYYSAIETRQLLIAVMVVAIGLYAYEYSRERFEAEARAGQRAGRHYHTRMTELHARVDRSKSEFVTLASHQLRTPISAIAWSSEMLLNGDVEKLKPAQREYVQGIYDSTRRLSAIVDAMLLVSGLEMGEVHSHPEPNDLRAIAHKCLHGELKKYADKNLVVHEQYDDTLPKLRLDPSLTRHILENLFSNAAKYSPPKGSITVTVMRSADKLSPESAGSVLIIIADTGYGIPKKDQQDVFAKMFRADNIKLKDTNGTGLGLYIVKALVDRVGGRISFTSEENKGTTFTVQLPLEGMRG